MASDDCDICDEALNGNRTSLSQGEYNYYAVMLLCQLVAAGGGGGGGGGGDFSALTPITQATIDAASITGSYQVVLNDVHAKKYILVQNETNAPIQVSLNGTNDHFYVRANGSVRLSSGESQLTVSTTIQVKAADFSNDPPTTGTVYIDAYY